MRERTSVVFCVGKVKPVVLNSQVNIGQSQLERKEIHKLFVLSFVKNMNRLSMKNTHITLNFACYKCLGFPCLI